MIDYLNQDHPALRQFPAQRLFAARELLRQALDLSHLFRIQFDRARLQRVIGAERFSRLMPNPASRPADHREPSPTYDIFEGVVDAANKEILQQTLDPEPTDFPERPLNYIRSFRLLDKDHRTVMRSGDRNAFILFTLPGPQRAALSDAFQSQSIPTDVVEQIDVDVEGLEP
jgi:hypothetical protein